MGFGNYRKKELEGNKQRSLQKERKTQTNNQTNK